MHRPPHPPTALISLNQTGGGGGQPLGHSGSWPVSSGALSPLSRVSREETEHLSIESSEIVKEAGGVQAGRAEALRSPNLRLRTGCAVTLDK